MKELHLFGRKMPLPRSRPARIVLGSALCAGGMVGFLPIVGFWMLPLGVAVLSVDSPRIHRLAQRVGGWFRRRRGAPESGEEIRSLPRTTD